MIGEDDGPIAILLRDAINDEPGYQAIVVSDGRKVVEQVRGPLLEAASHAVVIAVESQANALSVALEKAHRRP